MATAIIQSVRNQLFRIVYNQLFILVGVALVILMLKGLFANLSALAGGLTYWIPTVGFIWRVSVHASAQALSRFMMTFFVAEALKLTVSGVFFLLLVKYAHVDLLYALIGLISAIVAFWIASAMALTQSGVKA